MIFKISNILLITLLALPLITVFEGKGKLTAYAEDEVEDDIVEDEDDETTTENAQQGEMEEGEGVPEDTGPQGSPNADTIIHFITPAGDGSELPAGKLVEFLVGFTNNGDQDFYVEAIDSSFRYPMDFNFYIQNFTATEYKKIVKPRQEATFMYSFYPAEAFAGRPLGLVVSLAYSSADEESFFETVYNQTVNIIEVDEGLDGETFFLYVFLLALAVLLLLAGHHVLSTFGKKKVAPKKVEMGTTSKDGIDYDWIPKEYLEEFKARQKKKEEQNGSAKLTQRTSPRNVNKNQSQKKAAVSPKKGGSGR